MNRKETLEECIRIWNIVREEREGKPYNNYIHNCPCCEYSFKNTHFGNCSLCPITWGTEDEDDDYYCIYSPKSPSFYFEDPYLCEDEDNLMSDKEYIAIYIIYLAKKALRELEEGE